MIEGLCNVIFPSNQTFLRMHALGLRLFECTNDERVNQWRNRESARERERNATNEKLEHGKIKCFIAECVVQGKKKERIYTYMHAETRVHTKKTAFPYLIELQRKVVSFLYLCKKRKIKHSISLVLLSSYIAVSLYRFFLSFFCFLFCCVVSFFKKRESVPFYYFIVISSYG